MCDDGISHDQFDALRQAYATLHAAAQQVLASVGRPDAAESLTALRAAVSTDPAQFTRASAPTFSILLKQHPH